MFVIKFCSTFRECSKIFVNFNNLKQLRLTVFFHAVHRGLVFVDVVCTHTEFVPM